MSANAPHGHTDVRCFSNLTDKNQCDIVKSVKACNQLLRSFTTWPVRTLLSWMRLWGGAGEWVTPNWNVFLWSSMCTHKIYRSTKKKRTSESVSARSNPATHRKLRCFGEMSRISCYGDGFYLSKAVKDNRTPSASSPHTLYWRKSQQQWKVVIFHWWFSWSHNVRMRTAQWMMTVHI